MTPEWMLLFSGATALSSIAFVCIALFWLRKLHDTVSSALSEAAKQQICSTKHMSETIAQLQKQQEYYTRQINALAQAGLRLQQELTNVSARLSNVQAENLRGGQTLH